VDERWSPCLDNAEFPRARRVGRESAIFVLRRMGPGTRILLRLGRKGCGELQARGGKFDLWRPEGAASRGEAYIEPASNGVPARAGTRRGACGVTSLPSERIQRQIDRLLDDAEAAAAQRDWTAVLEHVRAVLGMDPANEDARAFRGAAEAALASNVQPVAEASPAPAPSAATPLPASFVAGR